MKRLFLPLLGVLAVAALALAPTAVAASPHYIKGPTATLNTTGSGSLTVSWKAAGLGNESPTADFALTGTIDVTSQCYTKSGNPVNGVPKTDTIPVNATGTFQVRNGQVTGSLTVSPLSTLDCTGTQRPRILSASWDLFLNGDSLPEEEIVGHYP